jgi:hypothetical protein
MHTLKMYAELFEQDIVLVIQIREVEDRHHSTARAYAHSLTPACDFATTPTLVWQPTHSSLATVCPLCMNPSSVWV